METYEELYKNICRVCLCQGNPENMVPLTDISSQDGLSSYGKAVLTFANISIKNDCLPLKMCQNCLLLLKQAILFKKKCELSHQKLERFVRKFNSSHSCLEENLCQFVMFTQQFPQESLTKRPEKNNTCSQTKKLQKEVQKVFKNECNDFDCENNDIAAIFQSDFHDSFNNLDEYSDTDDLLKRMEEIAEAKPEIIRQYKPIKINSNRTRKLTKQVNNKKQENKRVPREIVKDIQCKICNKVLANLSTYNNHMQRHTYCRYICEHCAKKYATNAELQYHLASTHDIGPHHICKECGFKAPRKFELTEHERLHTGERPFACDKCGLTFRRRFIWKKHALYHLEKTVQCPQCPRKFYQRSEMLAHCNNVHERVYVYSCNECNVTYARPATVRRHLVEKHGIAREIQGRINKIRLGKTVIK